MASAVKSNVKPIASAGKGPSTAVSAKTGGAVATVPEHIKQGLARGNEDVGLADVVIPRLEIVQALSPCLKKNDPAYIEDAESGLLYNSVTRQLYGERVVICPVVFRKQWLVWKDRRAGGGFRGAFDTFEDAKARIAEPGDDDPKTLQAVETAQHFCLLQHEDTGSVEEIVISMSKTKLKVSRNWNALVKLNGNDRFSRIYNVFVVEDSNDKGEFNNFAIQTLSFTSLGLYRQAEALYTSIEKGTKRMVVDTGDYDPGEGETIDQAPKDY